jgi:hypothetical protein
LRVIISVLSYAPSIRSTCGNDGAKSPLAHSFTSCWLTLNGKSIVAIAANEAKVMPFKNYINILNKTTVIKTMPDHTFLQKALQYQLAIKSANHQIN